MVFPSTLSLISNVFTERAERARAIGLWGATAGVAIALGRSSAGGCSGASRGRASSSRSRPSRRSRVRWSRATCRPRATPKARPIDRAGFVLSTPAMAALVYTIIEAPDVRLGQHAEPRRLRARRRPAGARSSLGAPAARPDARRATIPQPALQRRVRSGDRVVLHAARVHLRDHPVLPVHQALRPAVRRRAPAARRSCRSASPRCSGRSSRSGSAPSSSSPSGLVMVTAFYLWVARSSRPSTGYSTIAAQMVLYGTGMGLTSAPATEAIMGVVPREEGRRRLGRQRRHAAARRHARRRGDRQRVCLDLREPPDLDAAAGPSACRLRARPLLTRRRARRRRTPHGERARGTRRSPRTRGCAGRVHTRAQRRLPGGRWGRRRGCGCGGAAAAGAAAGSPSRRPARPSHPAHRSGRLVQIHQDRPGNGRPHQRRRHGHDRDAQYAQQGVRDLPIHRGARDDAEAQDDDHRLRRSPGSTLPTCSASSLATRL